MEKSHGETGGCERSGNTDVKAQGAQINPHETRKVGNVWRRRAGDGAGKEQGEEHRSAEQAPTKGKGTLRAQRE